MISLGIIGEYVRLIFLESKGRPTYIVGEYRSHDRPAAERWGQAGSSGGKSGPPGGTTSHDHPLVGRHADDNMAEEILVDLGGLIARHPWWRARSDLTLTLLVRLGVRPPTRVLDVGCGWGVTLEALERRGYRAIGVDVSRRAAGAARPSGTGLVEADLTKPLPEGIEPCDAVLALDVIEHLDDDRAAVARLGAWPGRAASSS